MTPLIDIPPIEVVADKINWPVEEWKGNCYAVACALLEAGIVKGRPVYGHWLGPVSPDSFFAPRRGMPFQPHGWVETEEGFVVDPTRWVFEASDPYIFVGEEGVVDPLDIEPCAHCELIEDEHDDDDLDHCGDYTRPPWPYDEGGNALRRAMLQPPPGPNDDRLSHMPNVKLNVTGDALRHVQFLLKDENEWFRAIQVHWLANCPYDLLEPHAKAIYQAIIDADHAGSIPIDNKRRALG